MNAGEERQRRFVVDNMLGKLARWLRVLGCDARSMVLENPGAMALLMNEGWTPVTRREKFREVEGVVFIRSDHPFQQLMELITLVNLRREEVRPFSRCTLCNASLARIPGEAVFGVVPDYVFETVSDFRKCPDCGRVYWPGSHRRKMIEQLESLTGWSLRKGDEGGAE